MAAGPALRFDLTGCRQPANIGAHFQAAAAAIRAHGVRITMTIPKTKAREVLTSLAEFDKTLDKALALAEKNPEAFEGMHARQGNPISLGPRVAESDQWAAKQVANATAAGESWLRGVTSPRKNPLTEAVKAKTKWANRVQEAVRLDKFAKGVSATDEAEMYATITAGGSGPFTSGVTRRTAKVARVVADLRPRVVALATTLDQMPTDTPEQREAKMIAAKRGMEKIGRARRGITG